MKTRDTKKVYDTPNIEVILLDNDISMALSSMPLDPEGWGAKLEHVSPSPFKENLA